MVTDGCGLVGSILTDPIVAVPMSDLSTISMNLSVGATFFENTGIIGSPTDSYTKPVRTEDLVCPTWGLADASDGSATTIGPPYYPLIHPPSELINLDPSWGHCTHFAENWLSDGPYMFKLYDPPKALTPVAEMGPSTTSADPITPTPPSDAKTTAQSSARPADNVSPNIPESTAKHSPIDPIHSISNLPDPPASFDPGKGSNEVPSINRPTPLGGLSASPTIGSGNQKTTQGLGAIIYSAFGVPSSVKKSVGNVAISTLELPTSHVASLVFSIGGSTITANPSSAISIAGTTIWPGKPAADIAGTSVFTDPSGLVVGTSIVLVQSAAPDSVVNAAGQKMTISDPSAVAVGRTTLRVGGGPVTVEHTVLSLGPSGKLMMSSEQAPKSDPTTIDISQASNIVSTGSNSIASPGDSNAMASSPVIFTVAGNRFTASLSEFSIDGTVVSAGGSGITLSGTPISLAPSGHLIIGSSTAVLRSQSIYNVAGQTFTSNPSTFSIGSTTLSAGGAGIIMSGTPISLGSSGNLVIGNSTAFLPQSPPVEPFSTFTVDGQKFTGNPSALVVDGNTLLAGGVGVIVSGTPISLGSSGNLVIESNTVMVSPSPTDGPSSTFTVDGRTFTGNASALLVNGYTLLAGGTGATISGTPISLEPSGNLHVGSSEIPLATNGSSGKGEVQTFTGAQGKPTVRGTRALLGALAFIIGIVEGTMMWC